MPYYNRGPKEDHNFDNHPYINPYITYSATKLIPLNGALHGSHDEMIKWKSLLAAMVNVGFQGKFRV